MFKMFAGARKIGVALAEPVRLASHPAHWQAIWRDRRPGQRHLAPDAEHLKSALDWLCRAQDVCGGEGVSAGYFFRRGWAPPYPETTGYIIPTLLRCAARLGQPQYLERALRLGDWELAIQLPEGAVRGGRARLSTEPYPIVFNTGQVLLGWIALYQALGEERFLQAAVRGADWLVEVQDPDGKWTRHTYRNAPRAYHTRVAWALFEVAAITGLSRYREAAERNIRWTLAQALPNGWFEHMALEPGELPLTHTIAYTLRGLLESLPHLDPETGQQAKRAVIAASEHLMAQVRPRAGRPASLPATFDAQWHSRDSYSCLTGEAQLAILWSKLYALTQDLRLAQAARRLVLGLKSVQFLDASHPGIRGGIAGSHPLGGRYVPYAYLNWATKFFADALLALREPSAGDLPPLPG